MQPQLLRQPFRLLIRMMFSLAFLFSGYIFPASAQLTPSGTSGKTNNNSDNCTNQSSAGTQANCFSQSTSTSPSPTNSQSPATATLRAGDQPMTNQQRQIILQTVPNPQLPLTNQTSPGTQPSNTTTNSNQSSCASQSNCSTQSSSSSQSPQSPQSAPTPSMTTQTSQPTTTSVPTTTDQPLQPTTTSAPTTTTQTSQPTTTSMPTTTTQTSQPTTTKVPTTPDQPNQPTTNSVPTTPDQPQSNSTDNLEQTIFAAINQYRAQQGLPALNLDSRISDQARNHSQDMSNGATTFGHSGFTQRVQAIANLMPETAAAENVAKNQGYSDPASQAVTDWLHSPEQIQNLVGNYRLTGIGVAKDAQGEYYFTQIFVR